MADLTKAEEKFLKLQHGEKLTNEESDKRKNRERAARQKIQDFITISEWLEGLDDNEPWETEDDLIKLLVEYWEIKEDDRTHVLKNKFRKLHS